ncbi:dixin isoform X2 [Protopterus annectens]|uniref:dixin isoform X2 n=1 Tax=Protopterus annectens TaxID=7888 RepID=UPI001CFB9D15|nr:dixin isoform X2 [Protopterus annectens]
MGTPHTEQSSTATTEGSQQLQAYVAWVNSQIKKKPDVKPVQELRQDLRDGVVLAHLIEIVAGEKLAGIHYNPSSQQEMKENVEKILQFVASKRIRMHQTSARDIVDGNLKSTMRLILALAAHFKPSAAHRSNTQKSIITVANSQAAPLASHRPLSATAMAQSAVTALADVRQDMSRSGRDVFRYRQECQRKSSFDDDIENPYWSVRAMVQQYEVQRRTSSDSLSSGLSSPSPTHITRTNSFSSQLEERIDAVFVPSETYECKSEEILKTPTASGKQNGNNGTCLSTPWEDQLLEQQEHLEQEMYEAKKLISGLQSLLLNGFLPGDEENVPFALCEDGACPEEQLVIIRSRLDQSMAENQELKKELLKYKHEVRNLQGVKDALQQRLTQQDSSVLQLKQELLRASMTKDELYNQNTELQRKVEERNRLLGEYKRELGQKDRLLQQQQTKLEEIQRKLSEVNHQKPVASLSCHSVQSNGYLQSAGKGDASSAYRQTDDLQLVRDALRSLRNSFSGHDPQHHTIDSLEQGISSLMERLHVAEVQRRQERKVHGKSTGNKDAHEYRDSWLPNSKLRHSRSSPALSSDASTKVLYYTDRSLTPFVVNIPKRLGEVTLRDFKSATDREGNYRYHFKALDPEFGTVKEEVFDDDDIIPGWEGKIVAWVEEDRGDNS